MTTNRWGAAVILGILACLASGCRNQKLTDFVRQRFIGPPATQRVDMMMKSPDADVRREMVISFTRTDYGRKEPYLRAYGALLKHDADPRVRAAAARALGQAGAMEYWDTLVGALDDRSEIVRWDVAVEMERMMAAAAGASRPAVADAADKAIGSLQRHAVDDQSMDVRAACAWALRRYRRPEVVNTLIACLADREFSVRDRAHGALVEMLGRDEGYAAHAWHGAIEGGITWGPPAARPEEPRRWWWPFGKRSPEAPATPAAGEQPPPAPAKPKRAWWWPFGKRPSEAPATPAAEEQPPPAAPAKPKRAWWWPFGKRSSEAPATPSPGAAGT